MRNKIYIPSIIIILLGSLLFFSGCEKLVDAGPPINNISADVVYTTDATATSVLIGIYTNMVTGDYLTDESFVSTSFYLSLAADELTLFGLNNSNRLTYYRNDFKSFLAMGSSYWRYAYPRIGSANAAIEGLTASTMLTPAVKRQLLGEAKFMRAFFFFYLLNMYGDIPMPLTTDYIANTALSRSPEDEVWAQIINDLKEAKSLMKETYPDASTLGIATDRLRPTKWAAGALLARSYLYKGDWELAEKEADTIIANTSLFSLSALDDAFLMASSGNKEAIWQLQPISETVTNTTDGYIFILPEKGPNDQYDMYLSDSVMNNFEPNDLRKTHWCNYATDDDGNRYYYPYKYKIGRVISPTVEHVMVLRLGEQYLIRAEARAHQSKLPGAIADLNAIRTRAGLGGTPAASESALLEAIAHERRAELFTEWGNRWFDLRRTGKLDEVMSKVTPLKGGTWNPAFKYFPIARGELELAYNLKQTPGYN